MSEQLQTTEKPSLPRRFYESVKVASTAFRLRFTGYYGGGYNQQWTRNQLSYLMDGWFNNSRINYALEAGNLVQSSLVMSVVNYLGRVLPQAPLQVVKMDAKGKERPVPNHLAIKLWKRPNPYYSGSTLLKSFALSWITCGNAYIAKARNSYGQVIELWYVPPDFIRAWWPDDFAPPFIHYYEYTSNGTTYRVETKDIIHFRDGGDPATQGRTGLACIVPGLREICGDNEVPTYQYLLLKAGGSPPVVLALKDGQAGVDFSAKEVKQSYLAATTGDQRGKVFVSGNAVELTKVGFNPSEMDLKRLRDLGELRIASLAGISKESLGFGASDSGGSTYNNVREADKRTLTMTVAGIWDYLEEELTNQLGPDFGLAEDERFDFDFSQVPALREDQDALHRRAAGDLDAGGITIDEFREMIGMEPMPDSAGNVLLISSTKQPMTPEAINKAVEVQLNPPEPPIVQLGTGDMPKQLVNGRAKDEVMN